MMGYILENILSTTRRSMSYYAVAKGRNVGIYLTWPQCHEQVNNFKGAKYKKFPTLSAAEEYVKAHNCGSKSSITSSYSFNPQEAAVPLGSKGPPPTAWDDNAATSKSTNTNTAPKDEFWPESIDDSDFEEGVTNADLLSAMDEVEGLEPATTTVAKKRKLDANTQNTNNKVLKLESIVLEPAGIKTVGAFDFLIDDQGYVIVYTDGSCINNGKPNAIAGFGVYFGSNHPLNTAKPVTGRATNNVGEIQAAIHAIRTALDLRIKKLCISTDSQFLINSITLWVKGWKRRNWHLSNGESVRNVVDFKELDELLQTKDIDVKWNYVKAHDGIGGNEMADKLAREGAALYEIQPKNKSF